MSNKTIVIILPAKLGNCTITKEIRLDDDPSIQIEISDNPSHKGNTGDDRLFFCNQQKQKVLFNPLDYAYIESTSNHYSIWYPKNPEAPTLSKYTNSLGELHSKLQEVGLTCFWRVHSSYLVNSRCIKSFVNDKILLKEMRRTIPIGKEYKEEFFQRVIVI